MTVEEIMKANPNMTEEEAKELEKLSLKEEHTKEDKKEEPEIDYKAEYEKTKALIEEEQKKNKELTEKYAKAIETNGLLFNKVVATNKPEQKNMTENLVKDYFK